MSQDNNSKRSPHKLGKRIGIGCLAVIAFCGILTAAITFSGVLRSTPENYNSGQPA